MTYLARNAVNDTVLEFANRDVIDHDTSVIIRALGLRLGMFSSFEIGRCHECKHWYKGHCTEKQIATVKTDPQFYCANGEAKE